MLHPDIEVARSNIDGNGLIARRFIPKTTVVWTLDRLEKHYTYAQWQTLASDEQALCYQFYDRFILVRDGGEYMNHSCNANTGWQGDDTLVARRDIHAGDEITYDYASTELDYRLRGSWQCHCGAPACRKIITPLDCLAPEFQALHAGYLPGWTLKFIRKHQRIQR